MSGLLPGPDAVPAVSGGLQLAVAGDLAVPVPQGHETGQLGVDPRVLENDLPLEIRQLLHRVFKAHGDGVAGRALAEGVGGGELGDDGHLRPAGVDHGLEPLLKVG